MRLCTIDNSEIQSRLILEEVHLCVVLGEHVETLVFDVADIGDDNLILEVDWLWRHNPDINWERSTVEFWSLRCQERCLPMVTMAGHAVGPQLQVQQRVCAVRAWAQKSTGATLAWQRPILPARAEKHAGLKRKWTRWTRHQRDLREAVVKVAKVCIDEAIAGTENRGVEDGSMFLEQRWDLELARGVAGPLLQCGAAGRSFAQVLAERASGSLERRSVEEMVPSEFHEFLDVFDKSRSERLLAHCEHDLGIDLVDGAAIPPPGKLYQLAPVEL